MSSVYFDNFTLILYIMIGIIGGVCIKLANSNKTVAGTGLSGKELQFYGLFILIFTSFAVVRLPIFFKMRSEECCIGISR